MFSNQELSISIKFYSNSLCFLFSILFCSVFCVFCVHLHQQNYCLMLLYLFLLPLSLVVHEFGHTLMALVFKVRVGKFCIFFIPWFRLLDTRVMISISGALMNLLIAYICIFAWVGSHEYKEGELSFGQQVASTNYSVGCEAKSTFSSISGYWIAIRQ